MPYSTDHINHLKRVAQETADVTVSAKLQWKHASPDESGALEAAFHAAKKSRKFATLELEAAEAENALGEPIAPAPAPAPQPEPVGDLAAAEEKHLNQKWGSYCRRQGRNLTSRPKGWGE